MNREDYTDRDGRLMLAVVVIATEWRARWAQVEGRCWSCGEPGAVVGARVATCQACHASFGPVR